MKLRHPGTVPLAFSTLGCPDWCFGKILAQAAGLGYGAVELRGIRDELETDAVTLLKKENRSRTRRMLQEAGIGLCSIDCSASFAEASGFDRSLREGLYAIEAAAELETPFIRIFGDRIGSQPEEEAADRLIHGIGLLCRAAEGTGVTVLLETHGDFQTRSRLTRVVRESLCPQFGLLWDIEHTVRAGERTEEFLRELLPYVKHVHLKDVDREGRLCLPGDGILNLPATAGLLTAGGYQGYFSLEWEKRWIPELPEPERAFARYAELMRRAVGPANGVIPERREN